MALPPGFDPTRMSFGPSTPVIGIPRNNSTSSSSSYSSYSSNRASLWSRFNSAVAEIGNWFADHIESAISVCCMLVIGAVAITGIIYVIGALISEGIFMAIITGIIAFIIGYICVGIGWYVILFGVNIVMYGLRIIFWNGWTLLLAIALFIGTSVSSCVQENHRYVPEEVVEQVDMTPRIYRCTARALNVRSAPSTLGTILGAIREGDEVEVLEEVNGFARIEYKGKNGYVSTEYLKRVR